MTCPACGDEEHPGPVGEPGTVFGGIKLKICPNLPERAAALIGADGRVAAWILL